MIKPFQLVAVAGMLVGTALGAPAFADVPPPNACQAAGQSCQTAGPSYDQPGVCTATKCSRSLPDGDGGVSTMEYDCTLCLPAGSATSSGSGATSSGSGATSSGSGATSSGGGSSSPSTDSTDSGCAMGRVPTGGALAGAMFLAGVAALFAGRRRG